MDYDLVVVGGGIQGVGVAQAAAAAGYSVLLLEKDQLAAATSRASSKLIHGGLRYLETAQFSLVRESLRERALLLELAPELVRRVTMHIPVYRSSTRSAGKIGLGLWLYRLLAGFDEDSEFSRLHRSEWDALDGLNTEQLQAVYRYCEAQTDDAALTRAVWASAESLGAELAMPAEFLGATRHEDSCEVRYRQSDREQSVRARILVNCAGPWGQSVLEQLEPPLRGPRIELVQGAHLLLPASLQHCFYLEAPSDRRAVFALPWDGRLLLGTTETPYQGDPAEAVCLDEEKRYLVTTLRHYFPALELPPESAWSSTAGLRVLPAQEGSAFGRPREVIFHLDRSERPRVVSLMGGKLTTYRASAERLIERIAPSLPARRRRARTERLKLSPVSDE